MNAQCESDCKSLCIISNHIFVNIFEVAEICGLLCVLVGYVDKQAHAHEDMNACA